jgi:class 3 adenylate cyclase
VPFSRSIVEQALRERRSVSTTDAEVDPRFKEAMSVAQFDIRAVLCAPARWHGVPVGALYVERLVGKAQFNEEDALQGQDLADLFGVAEMAWRGHLMSRREEWERERLGRTFDRATVNALIAKGGAAAVRRDVREVCAMAMYLSKLDGVLGGVHEEAWQLLSQLYGHFSDVVLEHGGAMVGGGYAHFGSVDEAGSDFHTEAVQAGIEIQKLARPVVKRFGRDFKLNLAVGIGLATGQALAGYFGAGSRVDFMGLGEIEPMAHGLAFQAEDGEVLIEANTYNKVRLHVNTHRLAPESLTGVEQQVQVYRVIAL